MHHEPFMHTATVHECCVNHQHAEATNSLEQVGLMIHRYREQGREEIK